MNKGYFVTGTDTGAGKTWASIALMQAFQKKGYSSCGMKPIASGGSLCNDEMVSDDAILLIEASTCPAPYELTNPVCFETPSSPNIAADLEGRPIRLKQIMEAYKKILGHADRVIVEGIGGWRTPCLNSEGMATMVKEMQLPVILVVGMRLGCINHALLTQEAILADGVGYAGWIANCVAPDYLHTDKNLEYLRSHIKAPLLGVIPYRQQRSMEGLGEYISAP